MVTTRAHSSTSSELTQQQQLPESRGEQESRDSLSELSSSAADSYSSSPLTPPPKSPQPKHKTRNPSKQQQSLFTAVINASANAIPALLQKITFIDFYKLIFNLSGINPPEISSFDEIRDVLNNAELVSNNFIINKQIRHKFDIILKKLPKINTKITNDCVNFGILLSDVKYRQLRLFGVLIACYLQSSFELILNAVLIPRSKDIYDEIRYEIVKYLKVSNNYENIIISNALFDKCEKIRVESVELYKNADKLFRCRFSRRIVEMALFDTSENVRQIALKEARRLLEEQLVEDERDKMRLAIEFGINVDNYEEFKIKVKEICDLFNCKFDEIVYKLAANINIDILMQFDESAIGVEVVNYLFGVQKLDVIKKLNLLIINDKLSENIINNYEMFLKYNYDYLVKYVKLLTETDIPLKLIEKLLLVQDTNIKALVLSYKAQLDTSNKLRFVPKDWYDDGVRKIIRRLIDREDRDRLCGVIYSDDVIEYALNYLKEIKVIELSDEEREELEEQGVEIPKEATQVDFEFIKSFVESGNIDYLFEFIVKMTSEKREICVDDLIFRYYQLGVSLNSVVLNIRKIDGKIVKIFIKQYLLLIQNNAILGLPVLRCLSRLMIILALYGDDKLMKQVLNKWQTEIINSLNDANMSKIEGKIGELSSLICAELFELYDRVLLDIDICDVFKAISHALKPRIREMFMKESKSVLEKIIAERKERLEDDERVLAEGRLSQASFERVCGDYLKQIDGVCKMFRMQQHKRVKRARVDYKETDDEEEAEDEDEEEGFMSSPEIKRVKMI